MRYILNPRTGFYEREDSQMTDDERLAALRRLKERFEGKFRRGHQKIDEAIDSIEDLLEAKKLYEEHCYYR
jgi:hypothetical protein